MTEEFDPYQKWLGIPPKHQPPHHYRLLGLELFESDPDSIDNSASRQMAHVRTYQTGTHVELSQRILNEISSAKLCLLDPKQKSAYDAQLKAKVADMTDVPLAKPAAPRPRAIPMAAPLSHAAEQPAAAKAGTAAVATGNASLAKHAPSEVNSSPTWHLPALIGGSAGALCLVVAAVITMAVVFSKDASENDPQSGTVARTVIPFKASPKRDRQNSHERVSTVTRPPINPDPDRIVDETPDPIIDENPVRTIDPPDPVRKPPIGERGFAQVTPSPVNGTAADLPDGPATLNIISPCVIDSLRTGARVRMNRPEVFTSVPAELQGYQYTLLPNDTTDLKCFVRSAGTFYMLVREEDVDEIEEKLPTSKCQPTSLACMTGSHSGGRRVSEERYEIFKWKMPLGDRLDIDSTGDVRLMLASKVVHRLNTTPLFDPDAVASQDPQPPRDPTVSQPGSVGTSDAAEEADEPPVSEAPPENLLPIPPSSQQAPLVEQVREISEIDKLKTAKEKSTVAKSLIAEGRKTTDNPVEQFVMFRVACEVASGAGDLDTALAGVDAIGQRFEAETVAMRLKMAARAAKAPGLPIPIRVSIIERTLSIIDEAMAADYLEEAGALATSLQSPVRTLRNKELMTALAQRRSKLSSALSAYRKLTGSREALKADPDDPDANTEMGRYLCFERGRWAEGLSMLAKGGDEQLKKLATDDLAQPSQPAARWTVAEGWFRLADKQPKQRKARLQLRAKYWYEKSLPGLSGIRKVGTEKRLTEIREATADFVREVAPPENWPQEAVIIAAADYRFEMYHNGRQLTDGYYYSGNSRPIKPVNVSFKKGDLLVVRANESRSYPRAFACVVVFKESKKVIATGVGKNWQSYGPLSTSYWYRPGGKTDARLYYPTNGNSAKRIMEQTGLQVQCRDIWGISDSDPTSAYGYTYLVLQIK